MSFDAGVAGPAPQARPAARGGRAGAVAMVLAAAASIQFGAALAVTLFHTAGAGGATLLRLGWAAIVLWLLWRPSLRGRPPEALRTAASFGVALGLMNWSFYEAIARIPLGVAVTLELAGPLAVAVLGSRRPRDLLWAALAAAGILLLADPGTGTALDPAGVVLALAAGACWAAYILLSARTGALLSGGAGLAIAMAVAAVVALPAGLMQGGAALWSAELLALGLVVALASSVIPYSLEHEVLRRLAPAVFGVLMSLAPGLAAVAGFLVLDQRLGATDVVAIALVVAASAGAAATARTLTPPEPPGP